MAGAKEVLKDWIVNYLKSRDAMTKQITSIKNDSESVDVFVEGTLKNQYVIIQPEFNDISQLSSLKDKHVVLVTANTKENVEFLITNWDALAKYQHLCIYFVNPNSSLDKRWIIYPSTHDRITERKALRKGLESMFSTVEEWKE
jgi:2-hydroxy-3-keto-5-methylthiopentenyl-1-phosphate phosphatase